MNSFDDRKKRYESEFAHNAELKFKAEARRNKLLGQWVAGILGLTGDEAEAYAKTVILADLEEPGDEDVFRKVRGDLDGAAKTVSDEEIREKLSLLLIDAVEQIKSES